MRSACNFTQTWWLKSNRMVTGETMTKKKIIFYLFFAKFNSFNKPVTYILNFGKDFQIIFKKAWINSILIMIMRALISPHVHQYWSFKTWPVWWPKKILPWFIFYFLDYQSVWTAFMLTDNLYFILWIVCLYLSTLGGCFYFPWLFLCNL